MELKVAYNDIMTVKNDFIKDIYIEIDDFLRADDLAGALERIADMSAADKDSGRYNNYTPLSDFSINEICTFWAQVLIDSGADQDKVAKALQDVLGLEFSGVKFTKPIKLTTDLISCDFALENEFSAGASIYGDNVTSSLYNGTFLAITGTGYTMQTRNGCEIKIYSDNVLLEAN